MKKWIIVALVLIIVGGVMLVVPLARNGWDFTGLSSVHFETAEHEIAEDFDGISINTSTADVVFVLSADGVKKVVCYEAENANHAVEVTDGVLTVREADERKWYDHIGISIGSPKITLYLTKTEYDHLTVITDTGDTQIPSEFSFGEISVISRTGDVRVLSSATGKVSVETSTGDVLMRELTAGDVGITVSTGDVNLTGVDCKNLTSDGSTGEIVMRDVIASEKMSVTRSTGDVEFELCDAAEIYIKTSTGDVEGTLLTPKVFVTSSSTGDIEVAKTSSGGICEVRTSTGDIEIDVAEQR